jgi:hypothetical protein
MEADQCGEKEASQTYPSTDGGGSPCSSKSSLSHSKDESFHPVGRSICQTNGDNNVRSQSPNFVDDHDHAAGCSNYLVGVSSPQMRAKSTVLNQSPNLVDDRNHSQSFSSLHRSLDNNARRQSPNNVDNRDHSDVGNPPTTLFDCIVQSQPENSEDDRDNSFDDSSFANESNNGGQLMVTGSKKNYGGRYVYSKDHHRSRIDMCNSIPPDQLRSRSPSLPSMCNGYRPRDIDSTFKKPNTQLMRDVDNARSSTQYQEDSNLVGSGNYFMCILAFCENFILIYEAC